MITLEEIENITFRKAGFGGYKIEEVDDFVDDVAEKVKSLELTQRELQLKIENQEAEIAKYKEKEDSVQNALITAQVSAKQIKADAERKSQEKISEAEAEAEKILSEAKEKAAKIDEDTDAKVEELMNKALKESSDKIEENNRILDEQKKNIIKLMGEANKFRNSLLKEYKNHLAVINSMSKGEDFKKKQKEFDKEFPRVEGNKPVETTEQKKDEE